MFLQPLCTYFMHIIGFQTVSLTLLFILSLIAKLQEHAATALQYFIGTETETTLHSLLV